MAVFKRSRSNVPLSLKKKGGSFENHPPTFGVCEAALFWLPSKNAAKIGLLFGGEKGWQIHQNVVPVKSTKKETGPASQIVFFSSGEAKRGRISTWSCE